MTFPELLQSMSNLGAEPEYRRRGNNRGTYSRTGHLYINERDGKYYIRNKGRWFGTYRTLEDAVKIRDWFITHRWDKRWVNRACEETGVVRCTK